MKKISYVFPIYNEAENIHLLFKEVKKAIRGIKNTYDFSFVFVNDGSKDESLELLVKLAEKDSSVTVIDFSKNYGHQLAVRAGIDHTDADAVIIMDSDLQDPPSVSIDLIKKWEEGFDVVYAQRQSRQDTVFKKISAALYYRLLHYLADIDIPRNTGDFRLIDKKVVSELRKYREHNPFLRGLVSYIGFKQTRVLFDRSQRNAGKTGYPLKKMIKFASDGIISFSNIPLKLISRLGYTISALSLLGIIYALSVKVFSPQTVVEGWTFIVISIFFVGGVQLTMLGVIGSYIGRIYTEVRNRPLYGINDIYSHDKAKK